ncbi:MAG: hypothetical protein WBA76_17065 [Phormidesmis sp.]
MVGCNKVSSNPEPATTNSSEPPNSTELPATSNPSTEVPIVNSEEKVFPIEIGTYSLDELFSAGGGGCGMTLWEADTNFREDGGLFFSGGTDQGVGKTLIVLDGEFVTLTRTAASGEEFYGQQTSQTFATEDGAVSIDVDVALGKPGEIESVNIPQGTLKIEAQGQTKEIPVVGDAGC